MRPAGLGSDVFGRVGSSRLLLLAPCAMAFRPGIVYRRFFRRDDELNDEAAIERAVAHVRDRLLFLGDLASISADPIGRLCLGSDVRPERAADGVLGPMKAMAAVGGDDALLTAATALSKVPEGERPEVLRRAGSDLRIVVDGPTSGP